MNTCKSILSNKLRNLNFIKYRQPFNTIIIKFLLLNQCEGHAVSRSKMYKIEDDHFEELNFVQIVFLTIINRQKMSSF